MTTRRTLASPRFPLYWELQPTLGRPTLARWCKGVGRLTLSGIPGGLTRGGNGRSRDGLSANKGETHLSAFAVDPCGGAFVFGPEP
jgi:hypothetical protein